MPPLNPHRPRTAGLLAAGLMLACSSHALAQNSSQPGGSAGSLESDFTMGSTNPSRYVSGLQQSLADARRAVVHAGSRYSTQSDDVAITHNQLSADFYFRDGAHRLSPDVFFVEYNPETATRVEQRSLGASGMFRFSDDMALNGMLFVNRIDAVDMPSNSLITYDIWLTIWPSDRVRFDIDAKSELFDNVTSLRRGITMESFGLSMDASPRDAVRLSVRAAHGAISDGSEKWSGEVEVFRRFRASPDIDLGLRLSAFSFSERFDNGYFNPENYQAAEAMFRWRSNLGNRLVAELATSGGVEKTDTEDSRPVVKGSLQFTYDVSRNWVLDGGVGYFSSRQSNSTGFARTTFKAALHYKLR